ncbi:hypothetical protein ACFX10_001109 [Malus domestica]
MLLQREQEDEAPLLPSEDEEEEEKSEYDTESEEELDVMLMLKPLFVPKLGRHTIAEHVLLEAEEWALEGSRKKKLEERKRKTKQIVVEEIWKDKEIVRIKSNREGREVMLKEEETEKVRNMTEEERSEWERTNLKPAPQPKQKWMFMQKYYHKGAFFQSEADGYATRAGTDGIYARHYSAPTGEAKMDITNCPKSLNTVNVENHKG